MSQSWEQKHGPPTESSDSTLRFHPLGATGRGGQEGVMVGVNPARMSSVRRPLDEAEGPGSGPGLCFWAVWLGLSRFTCRNLSSHLSNGPV